MRVGADLEHRAQVAVGRLDLVEQEDLLEGAGEQAADRAHVVEALGVVALARVEHVDVADELVFDQQRQAEVAAKSPAGERVELDLGEIGVVERRDDAHRLRRRRGLVGGVVAQVPLVADDIVVPAVGVDAADAGQQRPFGLPEVAVLGAGRGTQVFEDRARELVERARPGDDLAELEHLVGDDRVGGGAARVDRPAGGARRDRHQARRQRHLAVVVARRPSRRARPARSISRPTTIGSTSPETKRRGASLAAATDRRAVVATRSRADRAAVRTAVGDRRRRDRTRRRDVVGDERAGVVDDQRQELVALERVDRRRSASRSGRAARRRCGAGPRRDRRERGRRGPGPSRAVPGRRAGCRRARRSRRSFWLARSLAHGGLRRHGPARRRRGGSAGRNCSKAGAATAMVRSSSRPRGVVARCCQGRACSSWPASLSRLASSP